VRQQHKERNEMRASQDKTLRFSRKEKQF